MDFLCRLDLNNSGLINSAELNGLNERSSCEPDGSFLPLRSFSPSAGEQTAVRNVRVQGRYASRGEQVCQVSKAEHCSRHAWVAQSKTSHLDPRCRVLASAVNAMKFVEDRRLDLGIIHGPAWRRGVCHGGSEAIMACYDTIAARTR